MFLHHFFTLAESKVLQSQMNLLLIYLPSVMGGLTITVPSLVNPNDSVWHETGHSLYLPMVMGKVLYELKWFSTVVLFSRSLREQTLTENFHFNLLV